MTAGGAPRNAESMGNRGGAETRQQQDQHVGFAFAKGGGDGDIGRRRIHQTRTPIAGRQLKDHIAAAMDTMRRRCAAGDAVPDHQWGL